MASEPSTAKPDSVPPVTVTSPSTKPVGTSLKVKVIPAVSPVFRAASSVVIATVGETVSTAWVYVAGAVATLPAPSVTPVVSVVREMSAVLVAAGVTTKV